MFKKSFTLDDPLVIKFTDGNNCDATKPKYTSVMSEELNGTLKKCIDMLNTRYEMKGEFLCMRDAVIVHELNLNNTNRYYHNSQKKRILQYKGRLTEIQVNQDSLRKEIFHATLEFETLKIVKVKIKSKL